MLRPHHLACAIALLLVVGLTGCWTTKDATVEDDPNSKGLISFHAYYPDGGTVEDSGTMVLYHLSGMPIKVASEPLLTSKVMKHIEVEKVDGGYALDILLTTRGSNLWAQATSVYFGRTIAMLVDGNFRTLVKVPSASSTGHFRLDGPFSETEATKMANYVNNGAARAQ